MYLQKKTGYKPVFCLELLLEERSRRKSRFSSLRQRRYNQKRTLWGESNKFLINETLNFQGKE